MKIKNWKLKIGLIVFGFLFLGFGLNIVRAQEMQQRQSALGVSPAIVELILEPGKEKTATISAFNITNFPLPIKGMAKNFTAREEIPSEAKETFDASSWIELEPSDFILQPKEHKEVKIIITPPPEAEPGGHYAIVYFQPLLPVEVLSPQTAYLTARVGVLNFLIVKGKIIEQANLGGLQTKKFRQFSPVEFIIPFENKGNIHLMPSGEVVISNFQGKELEKLAISPVTVLPQTTRELEVRWEKRHLLGKFTAKATIFYGSENKKLETGSVDFWVIPWLTISLIVEVLTLFTIFFILLRRRFVLAIKVLLGETGGLKKIKRK